MKRFAAIITSSIILAACNDSGAESSATVVRDSAGIEIVENAGDLWSAPVRWQASAEPVVRIGTVDGDDEYLFDGIWGLVVLSDGRVVVANGGDQSVRWYDPDGRFLFQRGGAGEGPGEFSRLGAISVLSGDTVAAVDWSGRRFTLYGPNGELGRTVRIAGLTAPPDRVYRMSAGEWILGTRGSSTAQLGGGPPEPGIYRFDSPILRISADGEQVDTIGLLPSSEVEIREMQGGFRFGPAPFGRTLSYAVANDHVLTGTADRFQFDLHSSSGRSVRSVRAPDVDVSMTPQIEAAYRQFRGERAASGPPDERAEAERSLAEMNMPDSVPAYSSILVDSDGNAWVGEYRFDIRSAQQFLVFDADGRFTGRASMPPSLRVMAIRDGRVWGRHTDDLGVEYVVAHVLEEI